MTLLRLTAAAALFVAPAAMAADASPASQTGDTGASPPAQRVSVPRKPDRRAPGGTLRPRIVDAPGAALMLIPASWSPATGE